MGEPLAINRVRNNGAEATDHSGACLLTAIAKHYQERGIIMAFLLGSPCLAAYLRRVSTGASRKKDHGGKAAIRESEATSRSSNLIVGSSLNAIDDDKQPLGRETVRESAEQSQA